MTNDRATAQLRALIERPERSQLWGVDYVITPRLIAAEIGDGKQLVCVTPLFSRPNYVVARVDSTMKHVLDEYDPTRGPFGGARSYLDAIMEAAEEEYGYHGDEEYRDENGDETRGFPVVDWGGGCTWGKPFPIEKWQPSPPLVRWYQRDASWSCSGKASGHRPTRWHLPSKDDAALALCRLRGPRRIVLDNKHADALPSKNMRCAMCSRASWRTWRIP
jgi:hypothetical protein